MRLGAPLAAGTVLSLGAVAAIASQDPGPVTIPRLQARHPLAAYLALAGAPFGNGWELFALIALIYSACLFGWGLRDARRRDQRDQGGGL
jgi:hypothetical protein